jgi:hypothetical protein
MGRRRSAALALPVALLASLTACTDPSPVPTTETPVAPCEIAVAGAADFVSADVTGEIQHPDGRGGLFESLETASCDGFERVIIEYSAPDGGLGELGLWADWVDEVTTEGSGEVVPIDGSQILQLSVVGVTWQPGTGDRHSVVGPSGDPIAEVQYHEHSGGSGALYLGMEARAEYRVFVMDDPHRVVVDVRSGP